MLVRDNLGTGVPVVVTMKFTGRPAVPVNVAGDVIAKFRFTITENVCVTLAPGMEACRLSW